MVGAIRKEELRKVPGVAETLDWAATLAGLEIHDLRAEPEAVHETMIALLKTHEDRLRVTPEVTERLLGRWRDGALLAQTDCHPRASGDLVTAAGGTSHGIVYWVPLRGDDEGAARARDDCAAKPALSAPARRRLAGFVRTLRDNGFGVGLAETRDALRVLASPAADRRATLQPALRALFSADRSDWQRFDEIFAAWWTRQAHAPGRRAVTSGAWPMRDAGTMRRVRRT